MYETMIYGDGMFCELLKMSKVTNTGGLENEGGNKYDAPSNPHHQSGTELPLKVTLLNIVNCLTLYITRRCPPLTCSN